MAAAAVSGGHEWAQWGGFSELQNQLASAALSG
jgi:hypothetical protein